MRVTKIANLPLPQSGCGNTRFTSDGVRLIIEFEYEKDGRDWIGSLHFEEIIAYRFRNELHSEGYESGAYESVAEIHFSNWQEDIGKIVPKDFRKSKRHFAIFLSSNGYFEVLASSFSMKDSREGLLE